jgi:hypothetical protein
MELASISAHFLARRINGFYTLDTPWKSRQPMTIVRPAGSCTCGGMRSGPFSANRC